MAAETLQTEIAAQYHSEKPIPEREALAQQIATPVHNIGYFQLFRYATKKDVAIIALSFLCAAAAGAIITLPAVVIGLLVGSIQRIWIGASGTEQVSSELTRYTIYFVYLFVGELVTCYIAAIGFIRTGIVLSSRIREQYLAALLRQNIAFFDSVGAGEIATHMTADANLIRDGISEKVSVAVQCTSSVVAAFVIGFIHDWRLTLIMSSGPVCIALVLAFGGAMVTKYRQQWLGEIAEAGTITEEAFSSIRTLVGLNAQTELAARYDEMLVKSERWANKARAAGGALLGVVYAVVYLSIGLGFWMGSRFLVAGTISYVDILTIVLAIVTGISSLSSIIPPLQAFAVATAAGSRLYSTIERRAPESPGHSREKSLDSVAGRIELRNVRHIYPSRPEITVLDELDLVIEAGKTTAIVGPSGSGKSTVIELIERFYDPLSGDILLDGHRLWDLELHWLRQHISLVQQSPTLFATTIFENIKNGLVDTQYENLSDEDVQTLVYNAAETANAHKFITELPDGYGTLVGEAGVLLSGGQKQRIAIARALVRNPKILLLDEATSALDSESEAHVQAAIEKASQGRTTVIVAHRLSTIKAADKIVVMVNGRIVEQGTHNTLLQAEGTYSNLATTQAINLSEGNIPERDTSSDSAGCRPDSPSEVIKKPSHTIPRSHLSQSFHADAVALEKLDQPSQIYPLRTLLKFIMGFHRNSLSLMIQGFFWSIQAGAGAPIQAVFLAKCLFALAKPLGEYTQLRSESNLWAGMHAVLGLVQLFAYTAQGATVGICTERLIHHVSDLTFRALLHKDMAFFDMEEHGVGALVSFLSTEPSSMAGMGCTAFGLFTMAFTTLIGALATSIAVGWKLGLVGAATVPVLLICGFLRFRVMYELDAHLRKAYQETASLASEAVSAIRTVMSLNRESRITARFHEQLVQQDSQSIRSSLISSTLFAFSQSASMLCTALGLWYGGTLVIKGEYTLFQFILSHAAVNICGDAAGMIFSSSPDLAKAKNSAARLKSLFDGARQRIPSFVETHPVLEDKIQFQDVRFTYPTRLEQRILNGLNLTVHKGKYIALVGASGSGKSTVVSLLERFYHPIAGSITMDGESVFSMDLRAYRNQVALVNQEPALFQGTIRKNLTLGLDASQYSQQDLEKVCKDAHILDFIVSLPSGFDTMCGVKGNNFSGGQKQRLAIARAILRRPKVLLLDEVTSALDSESQRVVQAALDAAAKGRTTISIAHRLSAIQNADIIFYLENGVVIESGTHAELIRRRGKYFAMSSLQNLER
ncbi:multidrug resistance protein-like protein 1 [Lindgomyces ingoldianus]|uniref:Multidrug resistance protein-like protein 1 n=1 Tax=Lindgomyces ingoldianus TaxID=673940 RepID=A0ACB6QBX8_9PLEO|nr:multidrug resistance protein-like protein 1 [Lindgomyces ingoldianus]KAF2464416.1 multidrug resistance protein-like protein 1 [Lindgomyces ingoldianus]